MNSTPPPKLAKIEAIIPVASRLVSRDWSHLCNMLQGTLNSILALPEGFISVSILGHERPEDISLGPRCRWTAVGWEPPHIEDVPGKMNDKGIKIRQGVRDAFDRGAEWVMFVDADDLISARLPELCDLSNHDAICFKNGYMWEPGSNLLLRQPKFHQVCGTSWIMRLTPQLFPMWLGPGTHRVCDLAHNERLASLSRERARVQIIEKPMVVYCVGHGSNTMAQRISKRTISRSFQLVKRLIRGKRLTLGLRSEFSIPT